MKGLDIVVTAFPKGVFLEGLIGDTSKPGTIMQKKATTAPVGGRFTYIAAAPGTDGKRVQCAVLMADTLQGKGPTDAYVSGTRCQMYVPVPGEDMNVRCGEVAGTGNTYAIGDRLIIDAEDGILVPETGSPQDTIFEVNEVVTQSAGSVLVWVTKI